MYRGDHGDRLAVQLTLKQHGSNSVGHFYAGCSTNTVNLSPLPYVFLDNIFSSLLCCANTVYNT